MFIKSKIQFYHQLPVILIFLVYVNSLSAQVNDSTYVADLKKELKTDSVQSSKIDSIYKVSSTAISKIEKEIQSLSRKEIPDVEKQTLTSELHAKKKAIKNQRETDLLVILSEDQKKIYHEKIKPSKPAVLHMGINHDRVNCNVCVKP